MVWIYYVYYVLAYYIYKISCILCIWCLICITDECLGPPNEYVETESPILPWGRALMNGIRTLIRDPENSLTSYTLWGHSKNTFWAIYEPGLKPSPTTESACTLILDFSAPQNCEKSIYVVYKPPSLWYFAIAAWMA